MARTFQTTRVMTDLTVGDNLLAGRLPADQVAPAALPARLARAAWRPSCGRPRRRRSPRRKLLDIDRYWNERCGTLEFSARRRTEIGRCLLAGPRLLLLDEPAAGLDPASIGRAVQLIRKLHDDLGLTVLLVEHYVKAVLDSCDLVYVLAEGKILAEGTPQQVAADPEVRARYLGTRMKYAPKERVKAEESMLQSADGSVDGSDNGSAAKHAGKADEAELEESPVTT